MNNYKINKYFLILANFKKSALILLLLVGIFLFPKTAYLSTINPEKIIELSNHERIIKKQAPLTANQYLSQAAYNKAEAIFASQRFEHNFDDRRFSAWIREVGYEYRYVGENLAIDFVTSEGVIKALVASPTHYKNLINDKFTETGVAVLEKNFNGNKSIVVVQIFGTPLNNNLAVSSLKKNNLLVSKNSSNNSIDYLTNTNHEDLNLILNNEKFLNFTKESKFINSSPENGNTPLDFIFTLTGFIYLGVFKIVSLKNLGL